jgi:hypothetical protein
MEGFLVVHGRHAKSGSSYEIFWVLGWAREKANQKF